MKIVDSKQVWKGFFSYLQGYEIVDGYLEIPFKMNLTFNGDSFTGTTIDSESEHVFTEPILVKGFIDNDKISFVVNYPYFYFKDENGNVLVDKSLKHPTIEYLGFYDEIEQKFSGTWEMIIYEEKISKDQYMEEVANGAFEMYREI